MMRDVMVRGTGKRADLDGYRMIGKTGSANIPENGGYAEDKLINSFVAAFPHEAPRYAIIVVLSEPQGIKETYGLNLAAWNAAPTASEIIARAGPLLGIYPNQVKPDVVAQRDGPKQFGKPGKLEELEEPLLVAGGR
jgi:cell division protein FtsI (penicillin-binding protein 3)